MPVSSFTVDITGTTGMRTGEWAEGEEFLILPDRREGMHEAAARIRLLMAESEDGEPLFTRSPARRPAGEVTVAEVEKRQELRAQLPHPVLELTGPDGTPMARVRPEQPGTPEPVSFAVTDAANRPLARFLRSPSRIGRRAYWRIEPADGSPPITGHRGTWPGWIGFVLTFPLWLVFALGSLLVTILTLGEVAEMLIWGAPKRVTWRRRWAPPVTGNALDFRYLRTGYRWNPRLLDARLAYSMAALHYFHKMHKD
ncbi:hypothetical protein [Streptomyces sp. YIM 98790]|uniref:hypothetical protein n=1 Tax=Streptomyces sp. YIM 98790 TaxID=2689077 RepID=UPI001408F387|nr:hypothetical protein [Streptomyces sp. YIM 98790]